MLTSPQSSLMVAGNAGVKYTIPSCLKAGYYLVRHEIIALHSAYAYPGAQFYPGCHQLKVTGGGSTTPSNLVAFPGAYKGSDAGITYDAYKGEYKLADTKTLRSFATNISQHKHIRFLARPSSLVRWSIAHLRNGFGFAIQSTCIFEYDMIGLGAHFLVNLKQTLSVRSSSGSITFTRCECLLKFGKTLIDL